MSRYLHRKLLFHIRGIDSTTTPTAAASNLYLSFLRNPPFKSFSNVSEKGTKTPESSFPISYLIKSCGLSPESALAASKLVHLETKEKADSVLSFFRSHGFTDDEISQFIAKCPVLLSCKVDKTLKPKIDFFHHCGISGPILVKILTSNPSLLKRSLNNQITPNFNFLKSFLQTEKAVAEALRRSTQLLQLNLEKKLKPNILTLRSHGVPDSRIAKLMATQPRAMSLTSDQFSATVDVVKEMGFDPKNSTFVLAVRVMSAMSKSTWEGKMSVYRSLGWSEAEILTAFKKQPMCMIMSEDKTKKAVDFYANRLGMKSSVICQYPNLLLLSLEKRVIPRCSVMQVLLSKGLIAKRPNIFSLLTYREKDFLRRFVTKYQEETSDLLKAYQDKVDFIGVEQATGIWML